VKDLCDTIKMSKIPIICICNDAFGNNMKSLANHTMELKYARPQKGSIAVRMMEVARKEGLVVDKATMEALVETCNNDIRWVLNSLQVWRASDVDGMTVQVVEWERQHTSAASPGRS
jgi:replication factor C subunit 1